MTDPAAAEATCKAAARPNMQFAPGQVDRAPGDPGERSARLLDQMELELEELEAAASEDDFVAKRAAATGTTIGAFTHRKPSRKPFPEHLPRERIVVPGPTACTCCGSTRLAKLGEDVTECGINFELRIALFVLRLPKSDTNATAVLTNELDAGTL